MNDPKLIATVTIDVASDASSDLDWNALSDYAEVWVLGNNGLAETVHLEVQRDDGTTYARAQSPAGTDIVFAADKAVPLTSIPCGKALRMKATSNITIQQASFEFWGRKRQVWGNQ